MLVTFNVISKTIDGRIMSDLTGACNVYCYFKDD